MIKGLTEEQENVICQILSEYEDFDSFFYGSRVKGNFVKSSDLDILLKGKNSISLKILEEIKQKFYESSLPFIVNIVDYNNIGEKFFKQIEKDLVKIN